MAITQASQLVGYGHLVVGCIKIHKGDDGENGGKEQFMHVEPLWHNNE